MPSESETPAPDSSPPETAEESPETQAGAESPYKNLWTPLVVVPGLLVMVLVISLLFGAIGRDATSIEEYLETVVSGGRNERQQALFALTQRVVENSRALMEGEQLPWEVDPSSFGPRLDQAWERAGEDEHRTRYVLAALMAHLGESQGVERLLSVLELTEAADPEARLRFDALSCLGALGDERVLEALVAHSRHTDQGLRLVAVVGMRTLPLEAVRTPLVEALGDEDLLVRSNAAMSLSRLGEPAGADVLRGMLDPEVYVAERKLHPERFTRAELVSRSRIANLRALAHLRLEQDRRRVTEIAESESDLNMRATAKRIVSDWSAEREAGE